MFTTAIDMFKNKDIRNKIIFTLIMLFVFRFGAAVTVPGVNIDSLVSATNEASLFGIMNMLGGGSIEKLSIFALGVGPYITASIILQLLSMDIIPYLTELSKSGGKGRKKIDIYTRYLAVVLCFVQAITMLGAMQSQYSIFKNPSTSQYLYVATLLTAGSMFLLWIGDRITLKGIGNGLSIIIFAGIVSNMPYQFYTSFVSLVGTKTGSAMFNGILSFSFYIIIYLAIIVLVVFMSTAERKIPIQYTSSTIQTNKKDMNYLPLKINSASVIPVIFAQAVMIAPVTIASFFKQNAFTKALVNVLDMGSVHGLILYSVLILFFTFFYTNLTVDPDKISENLGKSGTYIPGIRPGAETKNYVSKVLNRITVLGALFLLFIALLPYVAPKILKGLPANMALGGTGLIIVVGVAMETVKGLKGQLTQKSYRSFIKR